jgi:hypothetical protein
MFEKKLRKVLGLLEWFGGQGIDCFVLVRELARRIPELSKLPYNSRL